MIFKSDKLDYLRCPRKENFFDNFFSIVQGPNNVGKLNWDLLGFFSFIFSLTWGVWSLRGSPEVTRCREMATLPAGYIPQRILPLASSSGSLDFIVCEVL